MDQLAFLRLHPARAVRAGLVCGAAFHRHVLPSSATFHACQGEISVPGPPLRRASLGIDAGDVLLQTPSHQEASAQTLASSTSTEAATIISSRHVHSSGEWILCS